MNVGLVKGVTYDLILWFDQQYAHYIIVPVLANQIEKSVSMKTIFELKTRRTEPAVRGGRAHFKLHNIQFVSKFKTTWIGHSPDVPYVV